MAAATEAIREFFLTPREQSDHFGMAVWHSRPRYMEDCHQHNDVELNYLERGRFTYLHGGKLVSVQRGDIVLFWASRPHQVVELAGEPFFWGLTIPLSWVLSWRIPGKLTDRILRGEMLFPREHALLPVLKNRMGRWAQDMVHDTSAHRKVMLLEIEALFRRFDQVSGAATTPGAHAGADRGLRNVEQMARYINEHFSQRIGVRDVAGAVGLHPNYAVNLFHKHTGSTLVDFLTKQRLAHAQLLLATTDTKVREVAQSSGFGSPSRFYAVFKAALGRSPNEYRDGLRRPRL